MQHFINNRLVWTKDIEIDMHSQVLLVEFGILSSPKGKEEDIRELGVKGSQINVSQTSNDSLQFLNHIKRQGKKIEG